MDKNDKYCIIGGDERQVYLGEFLINRGAFATFYALEKCPRAQPDFASLDIAVSKCGSVILPMPLSKDGKTINAPLSDITIELDERLARLLSDKRVFTSNSDLLKKSGDYSSCDIVDYSKSEVLAVLNAVPTAEGAIAAAIDSSPITLWNSRCLVAGFGRIGKILARELSSLGADVSVSARKSADLAWIRTLGYRAVSNDDIASSGKFDFIFNTVPYRIFDRETLDKIADCAVYIELASKPFGADEKDVRGIGAEYVSAAGLPGKTAAKTAAEIIYDSMHFSG